METIPAESSVGFRAVELPPPVSTVAAVPSSKTAMAVCIVCMEYTERTNAHGCAYHHTCDACFETYAQVELVTKGRTFIFCPLPGCSHDYLPRLRNQLYDVLLANKQNRLIISKTCGACGRDSSLRLGRFDRTLQSRIELECLSCHASFCLLCMDLLSTGRIRRSLGYCCSRNHICGDPQKAALLNYIKTRANEVKPCPTCFKLINRSEGCRNMTCGGPMGCGGYFCFDCLSQNATHQCEAIPQPARAIQFLSRHGPAVRQAFFLGAKGLATIVAGALLVPALPIALGVYCVRYRRETVINIKETHERHINELLRREGVALFNVPHQQIVDMISSLPQTRDTGMWTERSTCFMSYTLFPDALVQLHTHSHTAGERCTMFFPLSAEGERHLTQPMPTPRITGWFPDGDVEDLTAIEVTEKFQSKIHEAINRYRYLLGLHPSGSEGFSKV